MHWLSQSKTNGRYHAFAAPSPPSDWHGGPFPTHGELAQGLSLTMRPTRTASPLCFFLTAVTRNLAIARLMCEYSGPFWGMFSTIRLDIYLSDFVINVAFAGCIPAADQCVVQKSRRGLASWSAQLDSPGTTLTVSGWIRPGGQN